MGYGGYNSIDYFQLMQKMLRTFYRLHYTLLEDFRNLDICSELNLNKSQRRVIMHLYEDGEQIMSCLCEKTELQHGSMTSVIDSLEELNLVQRKRKKNDRRKLYITLTPEGINHVEQLKKAMNEYLEKKLKPLSKNEIQKFSKLLDELWDLNQKICSL